MLATVRLLLCGLLAAACWSGLLASGPATAIACIVYLATGGNYTLYLLYHTAGRDARGALRYLMLLVLVYVYQKRDWTVAQVFQRRVREHPKKVCLYFEDESWTFQQVSGGDTLETMLTQVLFCSWTSIVTSWHTSSCRLASSTETPWLSLWKTGQSTSVCGWAVPKSGWCLP